MPTTHDSHHDVVIVGARCAGAATALLLARSGHDVVVVDRSPLPSDTTSTHSLVRGGVVQLSRWGLLDEVLRSGAPAIRSVLFQQHGADAPPPATFPVKERAGVDLMLAPRRFVLDAILADAARAAGATVLDSTTAGDVFRDHDGRVTGVLTTGADGTRRRLHARVVVGADGVRSRLADRFGARVQERYPVTGACLYAYVGGVAWDGFEFHVADGAFAGVFPTHFGEAAVFLMLPAAAAAPVLHAGDAKVEAWVRLLEAFTPTVAAAVRSGTVTSPVRGTVGLPNHVRQAAGPGWALVGDAGYHRDPITGHGITDAFRDAELLADAIEVALRDPSEADVAYQTYGRERDAAIIDTFALTRALGAFPDRARFAALQMELSRALDREAQALAGRHDRLLDVPVA